MPWFAFQVGHFLGSLRAVSTYSHHFAQHTDPETQLSKIAFRAKSEEITHLSLILEAESNTARFQEHISMSYVNRKAIVWTMTNIPRQRLPWFNDGVGIRFSWDTFNSSTRPIAWVLSKDFVIAIQFWLAIWSGLYQLNDESQLQWCWRKSEELTDLKKT